MQNSKSYHLIVTESHNVNSRYFPASVVKRQAGRARVSHAAFLIDISCFDDKERERQLLTTFQEVRQGWKMIND